MIDRAELVAGNDEGMDGRCWVLGAGCWMLDAGSLILDGGDKVEKVEAFAEGGEEAAGTFDEKHRILRVLDFGLWILDWNQALVDDCANAFKDVVQSDSQAMAAGGDQGGERFGKEERIDFVGCEFVVLKPI